MAVEETDVRFSREKALGNSPETLGAARVVVVGAGALANNLILSLALLGVRQIDVIDFDLVEEHNVTRSPLFSRALAGKTAGRGKAQVLAESFLKMAEHEAPVARYAAARVEELGLGALRGASAIVSCVDSWAVRVTLARMARLVGVPLFDAGFFEADGYVTAYPNRSEDEPCVRCQYDPPKPGRASCSMYAREQVERGFVPTSQTIAGTFGALLAETVVRGLHGEFPLAGRQLLLNVRTGRSRVVRLMADPSCRATHRILGPVAAVEVDVGATSAAILRELGRHVADPVLELPHGVLLSAPCTHCGAAVDLHLLDWAPRVVPACAACAGAPRQPGTFERVTEIDLRSGSRALALTLRELGFAEGDIVFARDAKYGGSALMGFALAGAVQFTAATARCSAGGEAAR